MPHKDVEKCVKKLEKLRNFMQNLRTSSFMKASIYMKTVQTYTALPTGGTIMAVSTAFLLYELRRHKIPRRHRYVLAGRLFLSSTIGMLPVVGTILVHKYNANLKNIDDVISLIRLKEYEDP